MFLGAYTSQDIFGITKTVIPGTDQLAESWPKVEILIGSNNVSIDWVGLSTHDGETGIVSVHLSTLTEWSAFTKVLKSTRQSVPLRHNQANLYTWILSDL